MSRQQNHRKALGFVSAAALLFVGAASAQAQQIRSYPGSACQASGSAQDLYYSGSIAGNRQNGQNSAVCPIVRVNGLEAWSGIAVIVRDRHSTQNITCIAQADDLTGGAGLGWSETQSSAGEGVQAIVFTAPTQDVPNYGPYTVVCSLPAMEEVNQPSYIASYLVVEP